MQVPEFSEDWVGLDVVTDDGTIIPGPATVRHDRIVVRKAPIPSAQIYGVFNATKLYLCFVQLKHTEVAPDTFKWLARCDYEKCKEWGHTARWSHVCFHIRAAMRRHIFLLGQAEIGDVGPIDETAKAVLDALTS